MLKKTVAIVLMFALICTAFVGCKSGDGTIDGNAGFKMPEKLMTEEEYHAEIEALLQYENFSTADAAYLEKVEALGNNLEDMIRYNQDELECTGTKYYVSNNGDDENDGKSPETAWATLSKVNTANLSAGDMVVFERGGVFRGYIYAKNGVTYSAYGTGYKPKILTSVDGMTYGEWVATDKPNVWKLDEKIFTEDVGVIVFNGTGVDATYGLKVNSVEQLDQNLEFVYQGRYATTGSLESVVYLYCEEGNPSEVFDSIEISLGDKSSVETVDVVQDITIHNLELLFARNPFALNKGNNFTMSYCICGWGGGQLGSKGGVRFEGGAYVFNADNVTVENCYIYQQFDVGVSPQVNWPTDEPDIFENIVTKNCLFDSCEYSLEYFNSQTDVTTNAFKGMYFGYNFCRNGGDGFGDKASASRYIKSWAAENTCYDCMFEYNVFDRALSYTLEINSHKQNEDGTKELSYELMPKLRNNIYIQQKNKRFAEIQEIDYKFNEETYAELERLGVETGAVYMFTEKE